MKNFILRVSPAGKFLPKDKQLAYKLAEAALDPAPLSKEAEEEAINRLIDNAGVAAAALQRPAVSRARDQALAHPLLPELSKKGGGASLFGVSGKARFSPEWAAYANGVAVRDLDFHDTFLAADYAHPADNIPPVLAVAEHLKLSGADLLRAVIAAYEIHISLVKGICLHKHKVDHTAHLCPAQTAGIGALISMETEALYQAIQQAVHLSCASRQSRKGVISSWKACAPAFTGKLAAEAVDRALRGERSPSPIYEGEDSIVARFLDGPGACYEIPLPEPGEAKRQILESYTKAHSAEYQAQAFIDLAFELKPLIKDLSAVKQIVLKTSHHTHFVIGTGSKDPEKFDPEAGRETLDHSLMFIFAVALQDGEWSHELSYKPERARRADTVALWRKIKTCEEAFWTQKYCQPDPAKKAFGGEAEIHLSDGSLIRRRKELADAHPFGKSPFKRPDYIKKFQTLTEGVLSEKERDRFLDAAQNLRNIKAGGLTALNIQAGIPPESQTQGLF